VVVTPIPSQLREVAQHLGAHQLVISMEVVACLAVAVWALVMMAPVVADWDLTVEAV
jgi:hypothetical protein